MAESFALLRTFRELFDGHKYNHRNSTLGDLVASRLYEDLVNLGRSARLVQRVHKRERVVNAGNQTVGIVGVNFAPANTSYEGEREWPTDGHKHKHPVQEAGDAERRVLQSAAPKFDEFQVLRFQSTNVAPFPFAWIDYDQTAKEYSAMLVRLSREYDRRFP